MTGYSAESQTGRVTATQQDTIWTPRTPRPGKCGVILLPGSDNPRAYVDGVIQPASMRMAAAIAGEGIPCITSDFYNNSWGNSNCMTAITNAWTVLKAAFPLMRTDKVCLFGASMGAAAAARWSQLNPTNVAAIVGLIPAWSMKYEYQNIPAITAAIETAWGFSGIGNYPAGADLLANAALAAGIPTLTGYATDDTIALPTGVQAYNTAVGGTLVSLGALGHTDAAIAAMPISTVVRHLVANGA
jgi:pimeloyl-ACP methyl ester carboxylesterase